MSNVTMSIDDALLLKARRMALEKNTSVNALVRQFLQGLVGEDNAAREEMVQRFRASVARHKLVIGKKKWVREELYER